MLAVLMGCTAESSGSQTVVSHVTLVVLGPLQAVLRDNMTYASVMHLS